MTADKNELKAPNPHAKTINRNDIRVEKLQLLDHHEKDPETWISVLDPYIPQILRERSNAVLGEGEDAPALPPSEEMITFLRAGEEATKRDLLSYMCVHQQRWEAMIWLSTEMLQACPPYSEIVSQLDRLPASLSLQRNQTLDEFTSSLAPSGGRDPVEWSPISYAEGRLPKNDLSPDSLRHQTLGQIWLTLGIMILQAADRAKSDPSYGLIMSSVLHILGHAHHLDLLPESIYNYEIGEEESRTRRPPTMYLLSQRIMTVLTDTAWKTHWEGEMARAKEYGYDLPPPRVQPQIPHVGPEIWLDLILWICVEGAWTSEGGRIVLEMEKRRNEPSSRWSTISWDEICRTKRPQLGVTALLKLQLDRSRVNQSTGISIANSGVNSIEPGPRTVSREVTMALMDGLANVLHEQPSIDTNEIRPDKEWIFACEALVRAGSDPGNPENVSDFILRGFDTRHVDNIGDQDSLMRLLQLSTDLKAQIESTRRHTSSPENQYGDRSAPILGLFYNLLDDFARRSNTQDTLVAFQQIQNIVDSNRDVYIKLFADELKSRLYDEQRLQNKSGRVKRGGSVLFPELPICAIDSLMNLIIDTRFFEFGAWILFNNDIDGGAMNPRMLDEQSLQPVLLRYAVESDNAELKKAILHRLAQAPESGLTVHALLREDMFQGNWGAAEDRFQQLATVRGIAWTASDAAELAACLLRADSVGDIQDIRRSSSILRDLLSGKYDNRRSAGSPSKYSVRQTVNQLRRILGSIGKPFDQLLLETQGDGNEDGRSHYSVMIPSDAFAIILRAVANHKGSFASISLWKKFVATPGRPVPSSDGANVQPDCNREHVVQPTFAMLQVLILQLRNDMESMSANDSPKTMRKAKEMMGWAVRIGKEMGYGKENLLPRFE